MKITHHLYLGWRFMERHDDFLSARTFENVEGEDYDKRTYLDVNMTVGYAPRVRISCYGPDSLALSREVRRHFGGSWEKNYNDYNMNVSREFPDDGGVRVTIEVPRENACTKRVVGTETVTEPARTYEREIVEWDCN